MKPEELRIRRSRILTVRRHHPDRFTPGDEGIVEFGPGLMSFLALRDAAGRSLGEGSAPEWTIPVGAAGTAAYAVVDPAVQESINCWTGVTNEIEWKRALEEGETVIAYCRLDRLGRSTAVLPYESYSLERGDLLVRGEFVFVNVAPSGPRKFTADFFGTAEPAPPPSGAAPQVPSSSVAASIEPSVTMERARVYTLDGRDAIYPIRVSPATSLPLETSFRLPDDLSRCGILKVTVRHRGREISSHCASVVPLSIDSSAGYELEVTTEKAQPIERDPLIVRGDEIHRMTSGAFEESAEEQEDIFRLRRPFRTRAAESLVEGAEWEWMFPIDLFRMLVSPIAGGTAPIGRRLHPYGRIAEGMAVWAALNAFPGTRPIRARVHWIVPIEGTVDFRLAGRVSAVSGGEVTLATQLFEGARHVTDVEVTVSRV